MDKINHYEPEYEKDYDCEFTKDECVATGYHYANISVPVEIKPCTKLGKVTVECCGEPIVECCEDKCDKKCEITITQKVSIKIPVCYEVTACMGESTCDCEPDYCK